MPYELVKKLDSKKSYQEILKILTEVVRVRKGKILSCSQTSLKAKLGSSIMVRLFGSYLISEYFKNHLPLIMEISIEPAENQNRITVRFTDNLGWYLIKDSWSKSIYSKHFNEFLNDVEEKL